MTGLLNKYAIAVDSDQNVHNDARRLALTIIHDCGRMGKKEKLDLVVHNEANFQNYYDTFDSILFETYFCK